MPTSSSNTQPGLAIVANVLTPYRIHLHKLVAAGIPEMQLHSLVTHGQGEVSWKVDIPESLNPRYFGAPDDRPLALTFEKPMHEWRKGGRLIEYLKANNIRAVITFGYHYVSYLRLMRHCFRSGVPIFVHSDSNVQADRLHSRSKRLIKSQVYRWWMRWISGVMSMGEYGDQFFLRYGATPARLYRVPWPVDFDSFATVEPDRLQRFRQRYGLRNERRYLLYSGRLVPHKRVDLLIDAFAAIAAARPCWDLVIVGDGVYGDELRRRVPEQLRSRVIWTGFLGGDEPALAYHAADVLVLPSDREPWALVIQEAMTAGLTAVASDAVGAGRELITDGTSGRIFAAGDFEGLRRAIEDITHLDRIDTYKDKAKSSLLDWRDRTDPVGEIRRALRDTGVLNVTLRSGEVLQTSASCPND